MKDSAGLRPETLEEREVAVLNALLRSPETSDELFTIVRADDFYYGSHMDIFEAIAGLADLGQAIDLAGVAGEMEKRGTLKNLGDKPHAKIHALWDYAATSFGVRSHAKVVHETAMLRSLARAAERIHEDATNPTGDCQEVLANAERSIFEIAELGYSGQAIHISQAVSDAVNRLDDRKMGRSTSDVRSGFDKLDEMTAGFHNGELALVAARTSVGKTIFGLNVALKAATNGVGVFFSTLEQSCIELAERALCYEGHVDSHRMRQGWIGEYEINAIDKARATLSQLNIWFDQQSSQTVTQISANARRLKRQRGIGLVIIDYMQLIQPASNKIPRHEQVAEVSRRLKGLARELNLPVIAMTQVNRAPEDRTVQKPRLSDLRESGALEQDADVVLILYRIPPDANAPPSDVSLIGLDVAKQRNGRTGEIKLAFRKSTMRFENYQEEQQQPLL